MMKGVSSSSLLFDYSTDENEIEKIPSIKCFVIGEIGLKQALLENNCIFVEEEPEYGN